MVQCFAPDCNHTSERDGCTAYFRFPSDAAARKQWIKLIRRQDREPNSNSRVCSCHFPGGKKENGPKIFERNCNKLFDEENVPKQKRVKLLKPLPSNLNSGGSSSINSNITAQSEKVEEPRVDVDGLILSAEMSNAQRELKQLQEKIEYSKFRYSAKDMPDNVICMETGLPNKQIFSIVVKYIERFADSINYYNNWHVKCITLEDQIFMTLMKIRQNYTNLHLSQLFHCSTATVSNVVITFIHVLHRLFYVDMMGSVPSREKNKSSQPGSFALFGNCKMIIDCTDIKIACPSLMSDQKLTYSTYRGINSFKVLIGIAPNAAITFVSGLFPGSTSDKAIVQNCGILSHFVAGDLIIADKGFLIQGIVPHGVSVNIPPFLSHGKLTESEVKLTKAIARCRIHVERVNARLKDFQILKCIPPYLKCHAEKLVKLCCALVNLQYPLIRECVNSTDSH